MKKPPPIPLMPYWRQVAPYAWVKYTGEWCILHDDVDVFMLYHDGQYVDEFETHTKAQEAQLKAEIVELQTIASVTGE